MLMARTQERYMMLVRGRLPTTLTAPVSPSLPVLVDFTFGNLPMTTSPNCILQDVYPLLVTILKAVICRSSHGTFQPHPHFNFDPRLPGGCESGQCLAFATQDVQAHSSRNGHSMQGEKDRKGTSAIEVSKTTSVRNVQLASKT